MVLIGADSEGIKHLIALREGYRESAESWGDLIRDCRRRGMNEPACWIADGALGLWAAVDEQSPHSAQQRCTNHKTMNVLDKLPKDERAEYSSRIRAIWQADDEKAARKLAGDVIHDLREGGYDGRRACLENDLDRCLTFYQFPQAHWSHLRTSNVVESPFATVRLRTNAAKRFKKTRSGVHLMYQVMLRLSKGWQAIKIGSFMPYGSVAGDEEKIQKQSGRDNMDWMDALYEFTQKLTLSPQYSRYTTYFFRFPSCFSGITTSSFLPVPPRSLKVTWTSGLSV